MSSLNSCRAGEVLPKVISSIHFPIFNGLEVPKSRKTSAAGQEFKNRVWIWFSTRSSFQNISRMSLESSTQRLTARNLGCITRCYQRHIDPSRTRVHFGARIPLAESLMVYFGADRSSRAVQKSCGRTTGSWSLLVTVDLPFCSFTYPYGI